MVHSSHGREICTNASLVLQAHCANHWQTELTELTELTAAKVSSS